MKIRWNAALSSVALSTLFIAVYGGCNWITSQRTSVGSLYFAWERHIPFVPLLIIPYMSIDLFFVAAPFLTRSDRELRTLSSRIVAAILVAGGCFLIFPLKFAFARPQIGGMLGVIFNHFRQADLPFNQCPSLHITLCAILSAVYWRHTRGFVRGVVAAWFTLILFSAALTFQHHLIDIAGGFALAALCFYLFQDQPLREPFSPNHRIGIYYGIVAATFCALAMCYLPWSLVLLWPAVSFGFTCAAYFLFGAGIYRKRDGIIPPSTWVMLWPLLLAQRLSLAHYARQCRACDQLTEGLWIGRRLSDAESRTIQKRGVTAVVDLAGELSEARPFRELDYLSIPVLDLTAPLQSQIDRAVAFIQQHEVDGRVYLHCKAGYSRTAVVAGAYLLASGRVDSVDGALETLRRVRPSLIARPEAIGALRCYHQQLSLSRESVATF